MSGGADQLSPIEALLPGGRSRGALVVGTGCPPTLVPSHPPAPEGPIDLAIVAPSPDEAFRTGWVEDAVEASADRLAPDGIVYILAPPRARGAARRALRRQGLTVDSRIMHLPDAEQSRLLVPLERGPAGHAFRHINPAAPWKRRLLQGALALGGAGAIAAVRDDVGLLARREEARPLLSWLPLAGSRDGGARRMAVVSRSPRAVGSRLVVHPFSAGLVAPVVAKLRPPGTAGEETERSRLERIGAGAAAAGAFVPEVVGTLDVDGAEFTLETRVTGEILAPLLIRDGSRLEQGLGRACAWLEDWSRLTAKEATLDAGRLDREVLAPARQLAPSLTGGESFVARLEASCAEVVGQTAPLTASHNDLSTWNVLLDGDRLGVIDWESAEDSSLPLKDFFYLAVDAVAAAGSYDRRGAIEACFDPAGAHASLVADLQARLIEAVGVSDPIVELSFHSCWLMHGAYEGRKHPDSGAAPFREVVQWLAARPSGRTGADRP